MANQQLKPLVQMALAEMKAGGEISAKATDDILHDATNPELKAALDQGNDTSKQWAARINRALEEVGAGDEQKNAIVEAHYKTAKEARSKAPDDHSRDLGIIATGQLSLHYWIASFGTLGAYVKQAGMSRIAQDMELCLQEAKQSDEQYTQIAQRMLGAA